MALTNPLWWFAVAILAYLKYSRRQHLKGSPWCRVHFPAMRMYAEAAGGEWEERRREIVASRIEDPQPILPFALNNLEGEEVTSESYLGKVVVINFWGTW